MSTLVGSLRAKADALSTLRAAAQADEPDAVHQLRVAARTLRANLRTFADVLPDSGDLPEEVGWLGDTLAPAREAEVLCEQVLDLLDRTPDDLIIGPVRSRVREVFDMEHEAALAVVRDALDSERYRSLIADLDAYLDTAASTKLTGKPDLTRLHRKVRRRMRAALALPPGPDRDVAMHEARKAARRARYAAEALGRPAKAIKAIKALQDELGEEHDRVVTAAALTDLAAGAHLDGLNTFTYGVLIGLVRCDSKGFEKRVRRAWRAAREEI